MRLWQMKQNDPQSFLTHLWTFREQLSLGTLDHIRRLRDGFFKSELPGSEYSAFLEDWRALYLQSPTAGTMLQNLWSCTRKSAQDITYKKPIGFLVRTILPSKKDFPDFEFLAFYKQNEEPEFYSRQAQEQIRLFGSEWRVGDSASRFFQRQLFPCFYDAHLQPQESTPRLLRNIKYFLFVPIFIDRKEKSFQWLGVLQIRLKPKQQRGRGEAATSLGSPYLTANARLRENVLHLGTHVQILANDLIFAHVQESFDRSFPKQRVETLDQRWCEQITRIRRSDVACSDTWRQLEQLSIAEYQRVCLRVDAGREQAREFISHEKAQERLLELRDGKLLPMMRALEKRDIQSAAIVAQDVYDEILAVSKRLSDLGKGGTQWIRDNTVDVEDKIKETIDDLKLLIETVGTTVSLTVKPKGLQVKVDESKFEAILRIPLKNALTAIRERFKAQRRGVLQIRCDGRRDVLCIQIDDNGKGLSRKQIYDLRKNPPGIGLNLLYEYVTAAGGGIHWAPKRTGGIKLTITIPM